MEDDHRHCKVCGKVCARGVETCSDACAERRRANAQTRRTYTAILYGAIFVMLVLFVLRGF